MTEHYYTEYPSSKSEPKTWEAVLRGHRLKFTTDTGVFSKEAIDFGSKLLIESFVFPDMRGPILDIGCGYGPIGIALAKSDPNRTVVMADINARAVELAKENAKSNRLTNVSVLKSDLLDDVPHCGYAAIVTNPPIRAGKKVVYDLFRQAADFLPDGGEFWLVIQKKQGAASAKEKLASLFDGVDVVHREKGYVVLRCQKNFQKSFDS